MKQVRVKEDSQEPQALHIRGVEADLMWMIRCRASEQKRTVREWVIVALRDAVGLGDRKPEAEDDDEEVPEVVEYGACKECGGRLLGWGMIIRCEKCLRNFQKEAVEDDSDIPDDPVNPCPDCATELIWNQRLMRYECACGFIKKGRRA